MNIATSPNTTLKDIKNFLTNELAKMIEVEAEAIESNVAFDRYGLDSSQAVELSDNIANWIEQDVDPTILYDYSTIDVLSQYLFELIHTSETLTVSGQEVEA